MVYITGDCHGQYNRFSAKSFPAQKEMTRDDIVIVCGDFGIWNGGPDEEYWLKWLSRKKFTIVFVDGNHENFTRLYGNEFKVVDFHGGKAHKIKSNVYHLMRGYVFDFDGQKFWAFGGASSHDIRDGILDPDSFSNEEDYRAALRIWRLTKVFWRVKNVSWWEQELPSEEEMEFGRKVLEENNWEVDHVITHCCPQEIASVMGYFGADRETMYFDEIAHKLHFKGWHFGHYHETKDVYGKFHCRYENIERLI